MASFKAKFLVLQELFAKNHRGPFAPPPPSGARVKGFNTAPSKQNCLQSGPKEISNNRSKPFLKLSRRSLPKRNCCQSGPPKHLPERALRKLSRRVIPKRSDTIRALNTQLPERATSEAVKAVPSKQKCCQIGPTVTSNSRIGPFEGFQDDKKKLLKRAPRISTCQSGPYGSCQDGPL